jgi:phage gp45-like
MIQMFGKIKELLLSKINNILTKGILSLNATKQAGKLQMMHVQLSESQARDIPRHQNYGFFSMPLASSNIIVGNFAGESISSSVLVASMPQYEPIGIPGDVIVYHKNGSMIKLTDDKIEITSNNPINIYGDNVKLGDATASKLIKESFMPIFNSHTHICAAVGVASATPLPVVGISDLTSKVNAT